MGLVIEELDATVEPAPGTAHASAQEEPKKAKTQGAASLDSDMRRLMRRQLRVKAD